MHTYTYLFVHVNIGCCPNHMYMFFCPNHISFRTMCGMQSLRAWGLSRGSMTRSRLDWHGPFMSGAVGCVTHSWVWHDPSTNVTWLLTWRDGLTLCAVFKGQGPIKIEWFTWLNDSRSAKKDGLALARRVNPLHTYIHICVCICVYVCKYIFVYTYIYTYIYIYIYICICIYIYIDTHIPATL